MGNKASLILSIKRLVHTLYREFYLFFSLVVMAICISIAYTFISLSEDIWEVKFLIKPGQVANLSQITLFGLSVKKQQDPNSYLLAFKKMDSKSEIFQYLKNKNLVLNALNEIYPNMSHDLKVRAAELFSSSVKIVSPRDTSLLELSFNVYDVAVAYPLLDELIKVASAEQNKLISQYREQLKVVFDELSKQISSKQENLAFLSKKKSTKANIDTETVLISVLSENLEREIFDYKLGIIDIENALKSEITYETHIVKDSMIGTSNPISPAKDFIYIFALAIGIGMIASLRKLAEYFDELDSKAFSPKEFDPKFVQGLKSSDSLQVHH